jgi:photosystem II stability/assembly factor-like uncharacterized protein
MLKHAWRNGLVGGSIFLALAFVITWGVAAARPLSSDPAPIITDVTPKELPNHTNLYITVTGEHFALTPTLTLGDTALQNVTLVNTQTLTALVPWGLPPGSYTLTITNPDGQSASNVGACTVYAENGGSWTSNGPYGGQISNVFIDPHNSQKVYADAWSSGTFASADAAQHWQPVFINPMPTELVFQYYVGARHLYIGGNASLMHSADDGATWGRFIPDEVDVEVRTNPYDFHAAVNPAEPEAVYLGVSGNPGVTAGGGLFKYSYLTGSWTKVYPDDLHVMAVAFDPADAHHIYFGTRDGNFYSNPSGPTTWTGPLKVAEHIQQIVVDPFVNGAGHHNIWIATNTGGYLGNGAYLSQDDGATFQHIDNLPQADTWVYSVTPHPAIAQTVWLATGDGGYYTTNNGASWTKVPGSLPETDKFALLPDPSAPTDATRMTIYAATAVGIYKSTDGGQTWQAANQGLMGVIPESLAVNPQNPDEAYASTPSLNILKTRDGGRNWQQLGVPFAGWRARMAVDPFDPQIAYFSGGCNMDACVRISPDSGATYQTVVLPRPSTITSQWNGRILTVVPDPSTPGRLLSGAIFEQYTVAQTYGVIYLRPSVAAAWQIVKVLDGQVRYVYFDPHNPQRVYACSDAGLYRSLDSGQTWNQMTIPTGLKHVGVVTVHPDHPNTIYLYNWGAPGEDLSVQGIYLSEDDGDSWNMLTDGDGNKVYGGPVWEMGFTPTGPRAFYIATFDGLYRSLDDGHTLTPVAGLPGQANIQALAFGDGGDNRLVIYVGTTGGYTANAAVMSGQNVQASLMGAGIYRSNTVFHYVYLPVLRR